MANYSTTSNAHKFCFAKFINWKMARTEKSTEKNQGNARGTFIGWRIVLKTTVDWWDRVWFSRFDPLPLACFRISFGLLLFVMWIALAPNWEPYYAADGIPSLHETLGGRVRDWWDLFLWTEGMIPMRVWWWVGASATMALIVGWQTRVCTVLLFLLQSSMIHRNLAMVNGEDLVVRMLLLYGCFAPLHHALSIDRWLRQRRLRSAGRDPSDTPLPLVWPVRLMQVNVALIYLISLPVKLTDSSGEWIRGDAIYWSMMSNMWGCWPWPWMFYGSIGLGLSRLMTYGTALIEGAFPLLVWFRRTRPVVLTAITALHLGIALLIPNVTFFTLAMACAFWVFAPAETLHRWSVRLSTIHQWYRLIKPYQPLARSEQPG